MIGNSDNLSKKPVEESDDFLLDGYSENQGVQKNGDYERTVPPTEKIRPVLES